MYFYLFLNVVFVKTKSRYILTLPSHVNRIFLKRAVLPWLVWLNGLSARLQTERSPV